ncbi:SRPBCC family protein [Paracoccus sp. S-4012]|uniref:SRPBCC family protein n=1 Tax=Paracoccus sp. S-4012 TaxID=2665648 RepID=UPI0018A1F36D|nr:SRPBCC family protein [Paracoccus sp. S-4012]
MRFSSSRDVELPAEDLFDAVADIDRLEQVIASRKARVTRLGPEDGGPMAWEVEFDWRGRTRNLSARVTRFDRPHLLGMEGAVETLDFRLTAEVVALTRERSRVTIEAEITPRSMKARLLLQTAKLTKSTLDRRFDERVAGYVDRVAGA